MSKSTIKGLNKVLNDLKKLGDVAEKEIGIVTKSNAKEIEAMAKSKAPVDNGFLRNQIGTREINKTTQGIFASARYSAYMEFGTGGLVEVPQEMTDIAIQYKGKGVKKINIAPRPFLYPSFVTGRKQYLEDLKDLLKQLTNKF